MKAMIRLTPQRRFRVSDRIAVIAALVLLIMTFTGISKDDASRQHSGQPEAVAVAKADDSAGTNHSGNRKLSISLLLFGRG